MIIGLFFVVLMVGSIAGVIFYGSPPDASQQKEFNGYTFSFDASQNVWKTKIDGNEVFFVFTPDDVTGIVFPEDFSTWSALEKVYISSIPEERISLATQEFSRLQSFYNTPKFTPACPVDSDSCKLNNFPIKDCNNADLTTGVIVLKESTTVIVTSKNNCVTIEGSVRDAVMVAEKIAFKRLGVLA